MEDLLDSISNEICDKVRSQIDIKRIFRQKPDQAITVINQGITVLDKWQRQYHETKMQIEAEGTVKRWEFTKAKEIFVKPKHMMSILMDMRAVCTTLKEFFSLLGPDLKAVTGDADSIDDQKQKIITEVNKLENFVYDVFDHDHLEEWKELYRAFEDAMRQSDGSCVHLIDNSFNKLKSSEGAFDLLNKFKNIKTRKSIEDQLGLKYTDVLIGYKNEVAQMEQLFQKGRSNPTISKNMPPKSGSIAWARSIMGRIKRPIYKFKTKEGLLQQDVGKEVTLKYISLAKQLDAEYEHNIFHEWQKNNTDNAIFLLKQNILKSGKDPETKAKTYFVNFSPELKVIIREAKFLDRIGKEIPQTIINIALQEKDYMRHVDKLNQLLRGYNQALSNLKPVEKRLLDKQITKLDRWMDKGAENHNWFSLSISEYIRDCQKAIDEFKETKSRVLQHAQNIEKKVINIENAIIIREIDFDRKQPMDLSEFSEYFDTYLNKQVIELVKDYQNIGDMYLKSIEECTVKTNNQGAPEMRPYYYYWERRIFNGITKMIIRALSANKVLF